MIERSEAEARVRAVQAQLIHISRLSAMNTMGSTIAHELNQPLAAILNYMRGVERLLGRMPDMPEDLLAAVGAVASNAHRAGTLIRRLRDLVQHRAVERRPESLASLFKEAQALGLIDGSARGVECLVEICPSLGDTICVRAPAWSSARRGSVISTCSKPSVTRIATFKPSRVSEAMLMSP